MESVQHFHVQLKLSRVWLLSELELLSLPVLANTLTLDVRSLLPTEHLRADRAAAEDLAAAGMSAERRRRGEVPRDVGRPAAEAPLRQVGGVLSKRESCVRLYGDGSH